MGKFKKFSKRKKKRKRKKKFIIEIRTNRGWQRVVLLKNTGSHLIVKCLNGEILRRKTSSRVRWGKTKLIPRNSGLKWPKGA
jgi:hypothetical protein